MSSAPLPSAGLDHMPVDHRDLTARPDDAMAKVLVTGGAGFIGSHFVKRLLDFPDVASVTVLDALTYAGHLENLGEAMLSPKLTVVAGSILDEDLVDSLVEQNNAIVHFAAESQWHMCQPGPRSLRKGHRN
jgi:dTDP-D-glucose 4,6-dehydratase